ncbi:hypothetical protein SAMN02746098_02571 [Desulfosporosinus lacus DSM 15449]|uniref:Uncharacterized protein n=1 Tax=Desulfosporosinus lacus DSM 15449 TaxID=1121420 RepID=A0A1M5YP20_9FIRM|nr:hypothetical protein SAMN02746098_02571 [Desulfosporosinus lacus DSM 15449]
MQNICRNHNISAPREKGASYLPTFVKNSYITYLNDTEAQGTAVLGGL